EDDEVPEVPDRFKLFLEKAVREAKTHTSWITPNIEYERSLASFADAILGDQAFTEAFQRLQKQVSFYGFLNSLSQVVLKTMAPGVPDYYQGTELWDFSLVDPDNRRPVDYDRRAALLRKLMTAHSRGAIDLDTLLRRWFDGRIKMFVTWRSLDVRNRHAELFRRGGYRRVTSDSANVVAFMRGDDVLVAVPRLVTRLSKPRTLPVGAVWGEGSLAVSGKWKNAFTGEVIEGEAQPLAGVFARFPVAILEKE
ncbi:MAG TPA: malto-oligosyltrehalose synthase, partial [Thermoanaerobaculia bacterium]|nr:malto-oligosyltrehalose synthase [Thermoanaerobaculia bacterium]